MWLLDVNVLVARLWEPHAFHREARTWMNRHAQEGWATCPITQGGVARTLSNPSFAVDAPSPAEAAHWLGETLKQDPNHKFWFDDLALSALSPALLQRLQGPRQITDAYLLSLALHHEARLITFDSRMEALAPKGSAEHGALVILRP